MSLVTLAIVKLDEAHACGPSAGKLRQEEHTCKA